MAVKATKGLRDLSEDFKRICRDDRARILVELSTSGIMGAIRGKGCRLLTLSHSEDIVLRKSTHVNERTLMVRADTAAVDLNRRLIHLLKSPSAMIEIRLTVEV